MSPATRQARRDGGGSRDNSGGQDGRASRQRSRTPPTLTRRSKPAADRPEYPRNAPVRQLEGGGDIHYEMVDEE